MSRRYNLRSSRTSPRPARRPVHAPAMSSSFEPVAVHGGRARGPCLNGTGEPAFRARRRRCRGTAPDRRRSREGSAGCRGACGGGRDGACRRKGDSLQPRRGFLLLGCHLRRRLRDAGRRGKLYAGPPSQADRCCMQRGCGLMAQVLGMTNCAIAAAQFAWRAIAQHRRADLSPVILLASVQARLATMVSSQWKARCVPSVQSCRLYTSILENCE